MNLLCKILWIKYKQLRLLYSIRFLAQRIWLPNGSVF